MLTRHATHRMQQRAVPEMIVEILERYGSAMHHEGAEVLFIDKSARKRIAAAFGGQRGLGCWSPGSAPTPASRTAMWSRWGGGRPG